MHVGDGLADFKSVWMNACIESLNTPKLSCQIHVGDGLANFKSVWMKPVLNDVVVYCHCDDR